MLSHHLRQTSESPGQRQVGSFPPILSGLQMETTGLSTHTAYARTVTRTHVHM